MLLVAAMASVGATVAAAQPFVFETVAEESTATFTLTERLFGSRKTVVGTTTDIEGTIRIDPDAEQWLQVGGFTVGAGNLQTDSGLRDRQIRRRILQAEEPGYEHMSFTPTRVVGLPAQPGGRVSLRLIGDLTIREITQSVTFDLALVLAPTASSPVVLVVSGSAEVTRGQYELQIPWVPFVADVSDEVTLSVNLRLAATSIGR